MIKGKRVTAPGPDRGMVFHALHALSLDDGVAKYGIWVKVARGCQEGSTGTGKLLSECGRANPVCQSLIQGVVGGNENATLFFMITGMS
jgi:hypothetical protein